MRHVGTSTGLGVQQWCNGVNTGGLLLQLRDSSVCICVAAAADLFLIFPTAPAGYIG